jgi:PAS domain S-box-containing protein
MKDDQDWTRPDQLMTEKELSEYRQRAERLAFENKMLRVVLDSMPDNVSIKDLKGRYIFDNSGHARFLGAKDSSEVVGKTLFDFFPAESAAKFHAEDLRVLRSGEPVVQSVDEAIDGAGNKVWIAVKRCPCAMKRES